MNRPTNQLDLKVNSSDRKLNILILSWEYPPNIIGGLSRHVNGLSIALAGLGHEVHVLTAGKGDLPDFEVLNGVNVYRVFPLNQHDNDFLTWIAGLNLAMAFRADALSVTIKFDIIHAHDWLVGSAAITLKDVLALPLLSTIHAHEQGRHNGIYTEMQQFIHQKELQLVTESDQLIVCSDYMRDELKGIFKIEENKIAVIANGIDLNQAVVTLNPIEIFPILENRKYIFSMGRIVKEKGFETVIEAARIAKETKQELFFVIAGKGPMLEAYRQRIVEEHLESHLCFIGFVTDEQRNALLESSELTVFPSLYEPFGIVALESMILAKPTVVSETGGLKGIIKHLQTGMWMVPGDATNMMDSINYLLTYPEKAKEIGIKGREIAKRLYSWKRIAIQTTHVIEDTLLNKRALDVCKDVRLMEESLKNY
ncbi:glycosyltransferase family 4 protein [Bacillus sp. MRMR6]|uniref:glycosyltransferase family 4 protein n=1 Tax=Bacillus sp. MRMR6 TaxID=1928617 RepID=UPI0009527EBD|nr:glycosyltransferase family 4 protein [Bacillus sp. MRMR6]OLS41685.1 glycoside hydrolase [Bacillus sp. MRMR6]